METKKIKVVKDWLEPKSVHNIQVFLDSTNFYQRFIQGFSRIAVPLTSMLKTTGSPDKPAPSRNNGSRLASNRKNNSRPASGKNDGNGKINGFGVSGNSVEHAKKSGKSKSEKTSKFQKSSKSGKSKGEKTSKSRNSAKSGKKLLKSGNSINFDATEDRPKFLTPDVRTTFNYL